jgi:hypothetical protein
MKHWFEHSSPSIPEDVVIILIDPDFIFLRPISLDLKGQQNNLFYRGIIPEHVPELLGKGVASAQLYGLGAPWAYDKSRNFNRTHICGMGSPCLKTTPKFGEAHYR